MIRRPPRSTLFPYTNALPISAALLRRLNRERGVTILLVSHDLNLAAEVCDRLLLLAGGRAVAAGAPATVLGESPLAPAFGCEVDVDKNQAARRPGVRLDLRGG